jgi:uncharacterized protein with GYD domain
VLPRRKDRIVHFVLLASHTAETCPTSNRRINEIMLKGGPEIPALAKSLGVNIIAGPFVSREHIVVTIVEAAKAEAVDKFLSESGLAQWNSVRVMPSLTMEEAMKELAATKTIF